MINISGDAYLRHIHTDGYFSRSESAMSLASLMDDADAAYTLNLSSISITASDASSPMCFKADFIDGKDPTTSRYCPGDLTGLTAIVDGLFSFAGTAMLSSISLDMRIVSSALIGNEFSIVVLLRLSPESRAAKLVWRLPSRLPVVRNNPHATMSTIMEAATLSVVGIDIVFGSSAGAVIVSS